MAYISSFILFFVYIYVLKKFPYIKKEKSFFIFFTLFVIRLILSFNHEVSFKTVFAGQSLNSIFSIFSIFVLFFVINKNRLKLKYLIPFYIIIMSACLTTLYSGAIVGGAIVIMKWILLILVFVVLIDLFNKNGFVRILFPFYYIFIGILFSQFLSFALRQGKDTESLVSSSSSISYIAGYAHESAFSILLYTGFFISSVLMMSKRVKYYLPFLFFTGLIFANYRTAIISAIIPLVSVYIAYYFIGAKKDIKVLVMSFTLFITLITVLLFGTAVVERFGELGGAFVNLGELMSIDYSLFTVEERRLLSSRLYLWNMYLTEFSYFSFTEMLVGAGPEAWLDYFEVYAHNSFIAALFDLGLIGFLSLIFLFLKTFLINLKTKDKKIKVILLSFFFGFFIMSNSTMPLWAIEGVYLYAFIYSLSIYYLNLNEKKIENF